MARRCPNLNADEAILAGLLHDIGKLYVLMRAPQDAALFGSENAIEEAMDAWH